MEKRKRLWTIIAALAFAMTVLVCAVVKFYFPRKPFSEAGNRKEVREDDSASEDSGAQQSLASGPNASVGEGIAVPENISDVDSGNMKGTAVKMRDLSHLVEKLGYDAADRSVSLMKLFELAETGYSKPTPNADQIIKLWNEKDYGEVVATAMKRLKRDPNDIVGLLVMMEWAGLKLDIEEYSKICEKILRVIDEVDGSNFNELKPTLAYQIINPTPGLDGLTRSELEEMQSTAMEKIQEKTGSNRELSVATYLQALEIDGTWDK